MDSNKVSLIIPVYNTSSYLEKCFNSLRCQSYKNIEIIFVNDGSTDNSLELLKKFKKVDNRVKIVNQENHGVSYARNTGIDNSTGVYIMFVDSDDWVDADYVFQMIYNIKNSSMVCCNYNYDEDNLILNSKKENYKITKIEEQSVMYDLLLNNSNFSGFLWNKIFNSKIIQDNNIKFDEKLHINEDLLFICEYLRFCKKIYLIDVELYHYILHDSSALHNSFSIKQISKLNSLEKIITFYEKFSNINYDSLIFDYVFSAKKNLYLLKKYKISDMVMKKKCIEVCKLYFFKSFKKCNLKNKIKLLTISLFPKLYDKMK